MEREKWDFSEAVSCHSGHVKLLVGTGSSPQEPIARIAILQRNFFHLRPCVRFDIH